MKRESFNYRKFMAFGAIAVLILVLGLASNAARSNASAVVASGVDISNEGRIIAKYSDDLVAYDKQTTELGKRASFLSADLDPLQRKSDDLKGRLSQVQNAIREIVKKLKAANEWDDLDRSVEAKITDARLRSFIKETSFKQLLEESSNNLSSRKNEISLPLDNLRKKATSRYGDDSDFQIVRAAHAPSPTVGFVSLRCSINTVKMNIIIKLDSVNPSQQFIRETWAACHPGQPYPF